MKVLLVPVADRPECKAALRQSFALADDFAGNIIGCHLRPPRADGTSGEPAKRFLGFRRWTAICADDKLNRSTQMLRFMLNLILSCKIILSIYEWCFHRKHKLFRSPCRA